MGNLNTKSTILRYLVPLDGSHLAESVLPLVGCFSRCFRSNVKFLHVLEKRPPKSIHGDRHLGNAAEAASYLRQVSHQVEATSQVDCHVVDAPDDDVAQKIVACANGWDMQFIFLCTHGIGRTKAKFMGSIAHQVLALQDRPLVIVPPAGPRFEPSPGLKHILMLYQTVATDHFLLNFTAALAAATKATVHFFPSLTQLSSKQTRGHIHNLAENLRKQNVTVVAEPAAVHADAELLEQAEKLDDSLVVMYSQGLMSAKALLSGDPAPRLVNRCTRPLLLLHMRGSVNS